MGRLRSRWTLLIALNLLVLSVLLFYRAEAAAPQKGQLPFSNSVKQRNVMIEELREIRALLKEQNTLLRALPTQIANHEKKRP